MPKNQNYLTATGKIPYNMTNDYMFRAILQKMKRFYVVLSVPCYICVWIILSTYVSTIL